MARLPAVSFSSHKHIPTNLFIQDARGHVQHVQENGGDGRLDLVHARCGWIVRMSLTRSPKSRLWRYQYRRTNLDGIVPRR
jgi:hypothetical protein